MDAEAMLALGKLVKHWNVKYLDMNNCCTNLTPLKKFLDGSGGMMVRNLLLKQKFCKHKPWLNYWCKAQFETNMKWLCYPVPFYADSPQPLQHKCVCSRKSSVHFTLQLEVLDLSDWTEHPPFCPQILDLVTRVRREISLHGWEILESDRALIQEKLDKTNSKVLVLEWRWIFF